MFNAFEEGYLCLLKRFLFLSIHRLYFIQFLHEIYMEKSVTRTSMAFFWAPITIKPYQNTYRCNTAKKLFKSNRNTAHV